MYLKLLEYIMKYDLRSVADLMQKINFTTHVYLIDRSIKEPMGAPITDEMETRSAKQTYVELKVLLLRLAGELGMEEKPEEKIETTLPPNGESKKKFHPSKFDPKSPRAIAGKEFQDKVFYELVNKYPDTKFEMTWDFYKKANPTLSDFELSCIEKEQGDITFVHNNERHYIECCLAMGKDHTWMCDLKREKFLGNNKWYCCGAKPLSRP